MGSFPKTLLLLALVFFGPLLAAVLMYYGPVEPDWLPRLRNEQRVLIEPPRTLPPVPLVARDGTRTDADWARYRWSLIYARMSACGDRCIRQLRRFSQVYYALGGDRDRVQRVLLFGSQPREISAGPDLLIGELDSGRGADLIAQLGRRRIEDGRIFVADPHGNLVLSYPPDADQSELLEDLERLLDVSRIG